MSKSTDHNNNMHEHINGRPYNHTVDDAFDIVVCAPNKEEAKYMINKYKKECFNDTVFLEDDIIDDFKKDFINKHSEFSEIDIYFDCQDKYIYFIDDDIEIVLNKENIPSSYSLHDEVYCDKNNIYISDIFDGYNKLLKDLDCENQLYLFPPNSEYLK